MTSCAATTAILEALSYLDNAGPGSLRAQDRDKARAALASLEQLVEAAQEVRRVERESGDSDLAASRARARRDLAAALAAVGPGEETAG